MKIQLIKSIIIFSLISLNSISILIAFLIQPSKTKEKKCYMLNFLMLQKER